MKKPYKKPTVKKIAGAAFSTKAKNAPKSEAMGFTQGSA